MEFVFSVVEFVFLGFFGLVALLFVLALLFGKRIEKKWEYEAKFRDAGGRELGEFDIQLSRVAKEEADFSLDAKFVLKHPALEIGSPVEVCLADELVMQGVVQQAGHIRLDEASVVDDIESPAAGQICAVRCNGSELFAEPLYRD